MADALLTSLLDTLDSRSVSTIAGVLGTSEQSVSQGLSSSVAALLGGLACKAQIPDVLRSIMDLSPSAAENLSLSQIAHNVSDLNSPLISEGRSLLSKLFGDSEVTVRASVAAASGLQTATASTLLAMAAPLVMSFLGKRAREEGLSTAGLSSLLQTESSTIRNALPAGLRDLFWPDVSAAGTASPVVAQEVRHASSIKWLPLLAIALGLGTFWLFSHARRPSTEQVMSVPIGSASRVASPTTNVACLLPPNLNLPAGGVESRLLAFVQNPDIRPDGKTWFTLDQTAFDTGSATLQPESQAQIDKIATILTSCPAVHVMILGYADDEGASEPNLGLSSDRGRAVVAQLVKRGVSPDRLAVQDYGLQYPAEDNNSVAGLGQNRGVAMLVTQK